jgi:hypothetical protein
VAGNSFLVRVEFANRFRNEYSGNFTLDGHLTSHATDLAHGLLPTTWVSNKRFRQQ